MLAGVVAAVADDNQRFFVPMAKPQMVESLRHRVVKRGSSPCGNGRDGFLKFRGVVRERFSIEQLEPDLIVEIHDEHLVLRIAGLSKGRNRCGHFRELGAHAAAVVNHQAHGHRRVAALKQGDFLQSSVLVHLEVFQIKPGNEIVVRVGHSNGQHDQFRLHRNRGLA